MKAGKLLFGLCLVAFPACAQDVGEEPDVSVSAAEAAVTFMRRTEMETCAALRGYLTGTVLADPEIQRETASLSTSAVARTAAKYATELAQKHAADFLFYHPNTRYFIRINDKSYRGRVRLGDLGNKCYWERLPSQDVVYSVLVRVEGSRKSYFKASKRLTAMIKGLPETLDKFGKNRVYTALDKTGLKKLRWYQMRRAEADGMKGAGWCTAENMAFLTSHGTAAPLPKKVQNRLLSMAAKNDGSAWADTNLTGGILPLSDTDGQQIAAVIYTLLP